MQENIYPLNDQAIVISFGHDINKNTSRKVQHLYHLLRTEDNPCIIDLVPAYTTLTLFFDKRLMTYKELKNRIEKVLDQVNWSNHTPNSKRVHIPVLYNGTDLEKVAKHNEITIDDVIQLHQQNDYLIYMIGFLPGFPYLGGLDQRLATPRLDEPRGTIKAGSVGIAGQQTGIYPVESPGGWNIIGRTPVKIFDRSSQEPFLFQAGDSIKFYPINQETYEEMTQQSFKPQMEWLNEN